MSKIWSKLILILVVVLFIVGFKSAITDDPTVADAFKGLMSCLPFAEPFSEIVCNILGYRNASPLLSELGFVEDSAKLVVMSFIQPVFTIICSLVFLRIPKKLTGVYEKESYMERFGYRFKEMLIKILTAPLCAILAGKLITFILDWAAAKFGMVGAVFTGLITAFLAAGISAIPMIILGTSISVALLWKLTVTLLGGMLTTLTTIVFSIAIYYAFISGLPSHIAASIISFVVALIILDIIITCFQRALGSYSAAS
ncbi:MAG: hypothetical protein IIW48_11720 [Clostridia bacterium]|nr:hypothetical protein [Clostridia bacterium]